MRFASRVQKVQSSAIRDLLRYGTDPSIISFGGGYPDPSLFPSKELQAVYNQLFAEHSSQALQYTVSDGIPALRAQIASRMTEDGTPCGMDDVLVLQGAQQGLDFVAKLLLEAGDTVIVEDPTFLGALIAFNVFEPRYATVRMDAEGMDVDHLEAVLRKNPATKMIYTVPDFQNPTGVTMSLARRRRLIELANQFDVLVLEDSPYRSLRFEGSHLPTLKSLDTEGRVVYLGTFSKILAPGLRLGWAVAGAEVLAKLARLKLAADTQCSTLNMMAASTYLDRYAINDHIAEVCSAYKRKRTLMYEVLESTFPKTIQYTRAEGGLFTWLSFPEGFDTARFMVEHALPRAKVVYVPGAAFFAGEAETNHARFNFSALPEEQLISGMERLGKLLQSVL
ncbi:MAG TPA: PLP-dependent aminotransferase family protein [Granulicella sp.]|nr:PLP-dependent aminotransferase family protein [Granulicella sp.]